MSMARTLARQLRDATHERRFLVSSDPDDARPEDRGHDRAVTNGGSIMARRRFLAPLALAQFICSFAGSNMNVMINDITHDLDTSVEGVQATITLFLLVMAVLMIPCSKLS